MNPPVKEKRKDEFKRDCIHGGKLCDNITRMVRTINTQSGTFGIGSYN